MKNNRINKKKKKENLANLKTFFLACELKPKSEELWSVLEPFAYDVKPAFIHGSLGVLSYDPETYAIVDTNEESPPLLGYLTTITHPGTILLLDKLKGFNGANAFNYHIKKLVHAYTDLEEVTNAWCYLLSDYVLDTYQSLEVIEFGLWHEDDDEQVELLEKIEESL